MNLIRKTLCVVACALGAIIATPVRAEIVTYEVSGSLSGVRDAYDVRPFYLFTGLPLVFPFSARIQVDTKTNPIPYLVIPGSVEELVYSGAVTSAELRMGEYSFKTAREPWTSESLPLIFESALRVRYEPPTSNDRWQQMLLGVTDESNQNPSVPGIPSTPLFTPVDIDITGIEPLLDQAGVTTFRIRIEDMTVAIAGTDLLSSSSIPGDEIEGLYDVRDGIQSTFPFRLKTVLSLVRTGTGEEFVVNDSAMFLTGQVNVGVVSGVPEASTPLLMLSGLALVGIYVRRRAISNVQVSA